MFDRGRDGLGKPVTLTALLEARGRPGRDDPNWPTVRALRSELDQAAMSGPFDLRAGFVLAGDARSLWELRRRAWAAEVFASDPRVDVKG